MLSVSVRLSKKQDINTARRGRQETHLHSMSQWEGSSLERRLEKRVCLCIKGARVQALMWFQLCRTGCRGYLSVRAHISPTVHSVVYPSVNMSRV